MARTQDYVSENVSMMAGFEDKLAATLSETADEVAHTESLDTEQRAEIYTILQAMKANTEDHRQVLGRWVRDATVEKGDA